MKNIISAAQKDHKKKVSILHVTTRLDQGGVEYWLLNICSHMDTSKYETGICLIGRRGTRGSLADQFLDRGCAITVVPLKNPFKFLKDFSRIASKHQVIVLNTNLFVAPVILIASIIGKVKTRLIMLHSTYYEIPTKFLDLNKAGFFREVLFPIVNIFNRALSIGIMGCSISALNSFNHRWQKNKKYKLLNLGIDIDKFSALKENAQLRTSLSIPKGASVIGHVGRFVRSKNHAQFVRVARQLLNDFPDLIFLLVGDGPLRQDTQQMVENLGMSESFRFTGFRSDVPDLMNLMDICFFPSLHEGFPVTFIEAQVIGLVVATGLRPELKEAVCPENHPFCIMNISDVNASAQKIKVLLENPDLRMKMEKIGRAWAIEQYSIQRSTATLEKNIDEYTRQSQ